MTKLEQLIEELCPNGVEFKKIKDVFQRLKGTSITAGKMKEIENPNGEIKIFAGGKTVINANEADIPNANITRVPAVLVQSRGVIDVVYYSDTGNIIALRGLNVKNGHLVLDDVKYIDNSNLEMLSRSKLRIGDMLFTYVGTVGQVALIQENDKYYLAPNVALVRITDERFLPKYRY